MKPLIRALSMCAILAAPLFANAQTFDISAYSVENATLVSQQDLQTVLAPYIGAGKDFDTIQSAIAAVENFYSEQGYGAVKAMLPEQDIEDGKIRLRVVEAKIGQIDISGQQFFSEDNIRRSLPGLKEGTQPNLRDIDASLRVANENAAKQTNMLLRQGSKDGEIDAVVKVTDEDPLRLAVTVDNSGVPGSDGKYATGEYRVGFVVQHANLFDQDHALSFQYMTSPDHVSDVTIIGVGYRMPLYNSGDVFEMAYGYSNVDSGKLTTAAGPIGISGSGQIFSAKYEQMLPKWGDWLSRLIYGLDYRQYTNSVKAENSNESLVPDTTVHPLSLTYSGTAMQEGRMFSGSITYAHNIPGGSDGTTEDFTRPGGRIDATANYQVWRYNFSVLQLLPKDWMIKAALNGQFTRDALVSGEQFGAGGADSVRGFYERELANDKGVRAGIELSTPELPTLFDSSSSIKSRLIAFYDAAQLKRNKPQPGEVTETFVSSYGLGLRGGYGKKFTYRLDWGVIAQPGATAHTVRDQHVHGSVVMSF
jgi:hemolysin activation/secretion protein